MGQGKGVRGRVDRDAALARVGRDVDGRAPVEAAIRAAGRADLGGVAPGREERAVRAAGDPFAVRARAAADVQRLAPGDAAVGADLVRDAAAEAEPVHAAVRAD